MQKNQKIKAHTAEATVSVAALKSRKTRLRLKQPRFFNAPLGRPLHASSVRPKQWAIIQAEGPSPSPIENGKLRIDNSFGTDFSDFTEIIILHSPFSIDNRPHRPSGTSPTTGEVFWVALKSFPVVGELPAGVRGLYIPCATKFRLKACQVIARGNALG